MTTMERDLIARELSENICEHILTDTPGCGDIEATCEWLADIEDFDREDGVSALQCDHCESVVPGLYWTELDMNWRCPNCGMRHKANDGARR